MITPESRRRLLFLAGGTLLAAALWAFHRELHAYPPGEVIRQIRALPLWRIGAALALAAADYGILTGYDALALRALGHPLPYRHTALASFCSYAASHNLGMALLSGGGVRYRLYSSFGLAPLEIAGVVGFCGLTYWMGLAALGGASLAFLPPELPFLPLPAGVLRALGAALLGALALGAFLSASGRSLSLRGHELKLPPLPLYGAQLLLACLDWAVAAAVLFVLLPPSGLSFPHFLLLFLVAAVSGVASQVPGGLGVFETLLLLALKPWIPAPQALGALLAFRGIYYLLPLGAAGALLGFHELRQRGVEPARILEPLAGQIPLFASLTAYVGGLVLLLSGALPLPLPEGRSLGLVETSHFLSSLAGMGLLLLAEGLRNRADGAWAAAVALLAGGGILGALRGEGLLAAGIPLLGALLLLPQRRRFDRPCALWSEPLSPGWTAAVVLGFGASLWLGFFAFRHVEYRDSLWWAFTLHGDASRFLRASVGAAALALGWAGLRLLRPACPPPPLATEEDLAAAEPVVASSPRTEANLAFLGDKGLLFSQDRRAFLQYGIQGRTWVAFGDPVGPRECWEPLAWSFRERAHHCGGRAVFYEVGEGALGLCLDLGLRPRKIGEEAQVPLDRFTLEGPGGKHHRACLRKMEDREGLTFRVVPREEVPGLLGELREVSDQWLEAKHTREKGFSLGRFDETYLRRFPVALAERGGRIEAFANLWAAGGREELSPDLMRHRSDAPREIMEYLFVRLLVWGKEEGYGAFSLGMAPLSGLQDRALAPLEQRLGARLYAHGEHFYNFQGLRRFKEKFDPLWFPRYLAAPGGLALPGILADLAALISGGWTGIVGK